MKNHHFLKFFWWVGTHKAKMSKIEHFWRCFKTCSSHHKLSSKVCKIVLRACRNVFWWKITFWNTSGHIIGHNVTCSKSSKSPLCFYHFWEFWILEKNHDFDDDFEHVTLWPIIWPKVFQNVIFYQKTFLQALKTMLHTLNDSLWWLEYIRSSDVGNDKGARTMKKWTVLRKLYGSKESLQQKNRNGAERAKRVERSSDFFVANLSLETYNLS